MTEQKATNVHWHEGEIQREHRHQLLGQQGATLWFTGLSGSGKSTVAVALEEELFKRGKLSDRLDGDNIRLGINKNLGFTAEDRTENIRRIGEVAKLFLDAGVVVLTAFVSPFQADRQRARALVEAGDFLEIHCAANLEVCEQRDTKGLYAKARAGEIKEFTGISSPYEAPEAPELRVATGEQSLDDSVAQVMAELERRGIIPAPAEP
jgi:adenylylsulfate kinase